MFMVERLIMFVTGIVVCLIFERVVGDMKAHYENHKVNAANRLEAEKRFRQNLNSLENRILSVEGKNRILEEKNASLRKECDLLYKSVGETLVKITALELGYKHDNR